MPKRTFILGAGFSAFAGLPLTDGLLNMINVRLRSSGNSSDEELIKDLNDFFYKCRKKYPWILNDIELLFTYIDLALMGNSPGIFNELGYAYNDLTLIRWKLSGALVQAFYYAHFVILSKNEGVLKEEQANKKYWNFFNDINEDDVIITFNYDVIVERGLWLQNKWTFLDGYGLNKKKEDFEIRDAWYERLYPEDKPQKSKVKIFKLHGSLGWRYDDLHDKIFFEGMPIFFPGYYEPLPFTEGNKRIGCKWDKDSTFIEPSYIKRFERQFLSDIWQQAFQVIKESEELIIIGYSLPEADSAARIFLSSAIRSSRISSIVVVDQAPIFDKFDNLFGKKVIRVKKKFEEWVEDGFQAN